MNAIIICDVNIIMLMTIFAGTKMFCSGAFSFGELSIHKIARDEIFRWNNPKTKKHKKFGRDVIEQALQHCSAFQYSGQEITEEKRQKQTHVINLIESNVPDIHKGVDTSQEDKEYLMLAQKNYAYLATQERTLRSIAKEILPDDHLLSFADLVVDLSNSGKISKEDISDGLYRLEQFKEYLSKEEHRKIEDVL